MSPYLLFRNREFSSFKSRHPEMSRREIYKLCEQDMSTSVVCSTTIATILIFSANTNICVTRKCVPRVKFKLVVSSQSDVVVVTSSAVGCGFSLTGLFIASLFWRVHCRFMNEPQTMKYVSSMFSTPIRYISSLSFIAAISPRRPILPKCSITFWKPF